MGAGIGIPGDHWSLARPPPPPAYATRDGAAEALKNSSGLIPLGFQIDYIIGLCLGGSFGSF